MFGANFREGDRMTGTRTNPPWGLAVATPRGTYTQNMEVGVDTLTTSTTELPGAQNPSFLLWHCASYGIATAQP